MRQTTRALAFVSALAGLTGIASADTDESEKGERAMARVYFDFDSTTPKEDVLTVANYLECTPNETVILDAYADPVGSDSYNADLAMRRAQAVRDDLVELGIDRDRILLGIFGERGEHGDDPALARRVEVRTSDEPIAQIRAKREVSAVAVVAPGENVEQIALP